MIYLVSRSICQGPRAGLISLGGVALGFVFYMLCAALGITAIAMAAGSVALFLTRRPLWAVVQRWLMDAVLAGLAMKMLTEARRQAPEEAREPTRHHPHRYRHRVRPRRPCIGQPERTAERSVRSRRAHRARKVRAPSDP
ncbi:hypothetical protein ACEYYB_08265 [Paracoccus sp. p4-l81]|uniref:hypothetical protein n=1 Tax=Paracoccus sp. p4-l81 TaxID=3342806 RepID=UPI0035B7BBEF